MLAASSALLVAACHRRDAPSPIAADPTPTSDAAPQRPKLAAHEETFTPPGPPAITLSWPRIELPGGSGAAIAATIEPDLRSEARLFEERWHEAARSPGKAPWSAYNFGGEPYDTAHAKLTASCAPTLVAYAVVAVICEHSAFTGGVAGLRSTTGYVWAVDDGVAQRLRPHDVFGAPGLDAVAASVTERLAEQGASWIVDKTIGPADLEKKGMLDAFAVDRAGLGFLFSQWTVAPWYEGEQFRVHLDWKTLHALAPDAPRLATIERAARDPASIVAEAASGGTSDAR